MSIAGGASRYATADVMIRAWALSSSGERNVAVAKLMSKEFGALFLRPVSAIVYIQ